MIAGLLFMDLVWAAGLFGLAYLSATTALAAASCCSGALAIAVGIAVALLTWIGACAIILFALPKPRPGTYRMMQGGSFYAWAFGFIARRWIDLPPMGILYRQSALLRFIVLRAAGARVAFDAQISSDAVLLDPGLFVMESGALLGSQATVAGHFIVGDRLTLAPVIIHAGAQVAIDVIIGPGVTIGKNAVIEGRATVGPNTTIGDDAQLGAQVLTGRAVVIGNGARVPMASVVPAKTHIAAGVTWSPTSSQDVS